MLTIHRTNASAGITVSTVKVGHNRYETTLIVAGVGTLDGVITTTLGAAGLEHDAAVDFARGRLESSSRRAAMWSGRIAGERALAC